MLYRPFPSLSLSLKRGIFSIYIGWLSNRNAVLVSLLEGIGGTTRHLEMSKAVDSVYYLANAKYVAPLSFFQNVLLYYLTGSKTGVKINSAGKWFFFLSNSILIKLFVETIDVTILSKYFSRKSIGLIFHNHKLSEECRSHADSINR